MKPIREILLGCILIALVALLLQGCFLVQDLRLTVQQAAKALQGIDLLRVTVQSQLAGKRGLLEEATAAARESRKTIDVLQKTSLEERRKVAQFSDSSIQVVHDLDAVARNGAMALEGLQDATGSLRAVTVALESDGVKAGRAIDAATDLVQSLNAGSRNALDRTTETIGNVNALVVSAVPIEEHVLSTSWHIDAGSKSVEETLADLREEFRPQKKSFWLKVADLATNGAFTLLLHLWPVQRVHEVGGR